MLAALITEVRIVTVLRGPVSMIICVVVKYYAAPFSLQLILTLLFSVTHL